MKAETLRDDMTFTGSLHIATFYFLVIVGSETWSAERRKESGRAPEFKSHRDLTEIYTVALHVSYVRMYVD